MVKGGEELRIKERYEVDGYYLVLKIGAQTILADILDISDSGIGIKYVELGDDVKVEAPVITMISSKDKTLPVKIPVEKASVKVLKDYRNFMLKKVDNQTGARIKRVGLKFDAIEPEQYEKVKIFMGL